MNDPVLEKLEELLVTIKEQETYQHYFNLKKDIEKNSTILKKIEEIKSLQKKIVTLEHHKEDSSIQKKQMDQILFELKETPLYVEFQNTQEDLDQLFQQVKFSIENFINEQTNPKKNS